jgi:hypothetical protein
MLRTQLQAAVVADLAVAVNIKAAAAADMKMAADGANL